MWIGGGHCSKSVMMLSIYDIMAFLYVSVRIPCAVDVESTINNDRFNSTVINIKFYHFGQENWDRQIN